MKTIRKITLLAVCALAAAAFAQNAPPPQGGPGDAQGHRRGMPSADDQLKNMTQAFNLTEDQQAKIKPILEDAHSQMQKVMQDDSTLSREDRMSKMRSLHEAASAKVREVLTDEQKKKYDDMQKEMQDHMHQRRGSDAPANDAPPK
jgi:Spy/CpxP family protein refolding chaperone